MGNFAVRKIVKEYGNSPARIRHAIMAMKRRGIPHGRAVEAVRIVNAAHAGQGLDLLRGDCLCAQRLQALTER